MHCLLAQINNMLITIIHTECFRLMFGIASAINLARENVSFASCVEYRF